MNREIFQFVMVLVLVGGVSTFIDAQVTPPDACPIVSVTGPAGIVAAGDLATYTANIDLKGLPGKPTYSWAISVGEIVSGQGTNSIKVRRTSGCITATVEVGGFPDSCPLVASESSCSEPPPEAVKIGEMRDIGKDGAVIKQFAVELESNPHNQGYILVGHPAGTTQPQMYPREQSIRDAVRKADPDNFDDSRITISAVESSADIVEFWRVPPGASNPKCGSCAIRRPCPEVKIAGPAGYIESGSEAKFALSPELAEKNLRIEWSANLGTIIEGIGSPVITLLLERNGDAKPLKVSVKIHGLTAECDSQDEYESNVGRIEGDPIMFDEYGGSLSVRDELDRLDLVAAEWKNEPSYYFYFIVYRSPKETVSSEGARIKRIKDRLTLKRQMPVSHVVIISGGVGPRRSTQIYRVPADARKNMPFDKPT